MDINEFLKDLDNASNTKMKRNEIYDKCKYSVSKILEVIKRPFEKDKIAMMCFTKGFNDPESKYYHMTVEEILKSWQDKANIGMANGKILDTFIGLTLDVFTPQDIIDKYVSSTVNNNSSSHSLKSSRTPMFSKERKTLVKSMNYTPVIF